MPRTQEERLKCLEDSFYLLLSRNAVVSPGTDNYVIKKKEGLIIIPTAGANTRDLIFPNPALFKNRRITVVNFSGAVQNILSHDGTSLTLKPITGNAVATHAVENSTSVTTGRRSWVSDGVVWNLVSV